jgi:hypothetical protein
MRYHPALRPCQYISKCLPRAVHIVVTADIEAQVEQRLTSGFNEGGQSSAVGMLLFVKLSVEIPVPVSSESKVLHNISVSSYP